MIQGKVLASGEAVVVLKVRGPNGHSASIEKMVDTGFNDQMMLPPWVVEKLGLSFQHETHYTLAEGVTSFLASGADALVGFAVDAADEGVGTTQNCNLTTGVPKNPRRDRQGAFPRQQK